MIRRHVQQGLGLVGAVFILVVLSSLAAVAVRIGVQQQATSGMQLEQARAYYAARSALEWLSYRVLVAGDCANASFGLTEQRQAGFTVTASCAQTLHRIRNQDVNYYALEVTVQRGNFGTPDFSARTLQAVVADAP